MQIVGDAFNIVFFAPIVNALVILIKGLEGFGIPGALGLAIIILTIIIRMVVWPLMGSQLKSAKKMGELKPHLDALKLKHGKDKQAYALAQSALFKEHGYNPAAGCLPAVLQIPIIIALYQSISSLFNGPAGLAHINYFLYPFVEKLTSAPNPYFFGLDLAGRPANFQQLGIFVLLVPVVTALLQFIQSKMMTPAPLKVYPSDSAKEVKEKGKEEDMTTAMQSQMSFMMPLMIGYFAFTFPIGLALYWNTFSILGIYQQYMISGWGGMASFITTVRSKLRV